MVKLLEDGIVELNFDLEGELVNKFDWGIVEELGVVVVVFKVDSLIKGMIVISGKGVFIVGVDIIEFIDMFKMFEEEIVVWCFKFNEVFCVIEDLFFFMVIVINGLVLGGGLEMCLVIDFCVMFSKV